MTEEEAKTKWCPIFQRDVRTFNEGGITIGDAFCKGSACMMWREVKAVSGVMYSSYVVFGGYCGLAGKP